MTGPGDRDTLCGVATGTPDGGVAIVRLSGPRARAIGASLAGSLPPPRRLARRQLELAEGRGEAALVVVMPGPTSFTGEDVVELHVHAGVLNVRAVVEAALGLGARAAGPGDFSRRAFEGGRLDLTQAEGIAALIGARTEAGLQQARRLAAGELGAEVEALRERVFGLRGEIEAHLDFPEEVPTARRAEWRREVEAVGVALRGWAAGFEAGRRARERSRVVVAGPPNAGKSSLVNALVGHDRVIVAASPGTTRDYVEVEWQVGGRDVLLVDTAGQRAAGDPVEAAGVDRARGQVAGGDLVVWVVGSDQADVVAPPAGALKVESKRDLGARRAEGWLGVSTVTGDGVSELEAAVRERLGGAGDAWIGLARHRDRAAEALAALEDADALLGSGGAAELVAFQLGVADDRLGAIGGRLRTGPVGEDVLAAIFERFCIGK